MRVLYLLPNFNIFGGTPRMTLEHIKNRQSPSFLYVWSNEFIRYEEMFDKVTTVFVGAYGRNIFKHISMLLKIVDKHNIQIIQTQFTFGEVLGAIIKLFRPKIKLIVCFVGPFRPSEIKRAIVTQAYKIVDAFVFISDYVRKEKMRVFPILKSRENRVIYNATEYRGDNGNASIDIKHYSFLDVAGLIECKNINVIIDAMALLIHRYNMRNAYLYVAGDGPMRKKLEERIKTHNVDGHVFLLGYVEDVGNLLKRCDIFLHPAYAEGFGIAVIEAMMAKKPIIVSRAGALPELIIDHQSGLLVDPYNADLWAKAILELIDSSELSHTIGKNAQDRARNAFVISKYVEEYEDLYYRLLEG